MHLCIRCFPSTVVVYGDALLELDELCLQLPQHVSGWASSVLIPFVSYPLLQLLTSLSDYPQHNVNTTLMLKVSLVINYKYLLLLHNFLKIFR